MLRSLEYASAAVLFGLVPGVIVRPESRAALEAWARFWYAWTGALFLKTYLDTMKDSPLLPRNRDDLRMLLSAYMVDRALDQLTCELNDRPEWVMIPLHGLLRLVELDEPVRQPVPVPVK